MALALNQSANNLPQMTTATLTNTLYSGTGQAIGGYVDTSTAVQASMLSLGNQHPGVPAFNMRKQHPYTCDPITQPAQAQQTMEQKTMATPIRRLIKVIIVDPDEKVPLDKCVLYSGEEKLTDLTDQELFFEIDIRNLLESHNSKRVEVIDKSIKERTEYLEPVKVRDLRMVVVTVAQF